MGAECSFVPSAHEVHTKQSLFETVCLGSESMVGGEVSDGSACGRMSVEDRQQGLKCLQFWRQGNFVLCGAVDLTLLWRIRAFWIGWGWGEKRVPGRDKGGKSGMWKEGGKQNSFTGMQIIEQVLWKIKIGKVNWAG